jgi:hypothetical protein
VIRDEPAAPAPRPSLLRTVSLLAASAVFIGVGGLPAPAGAAEAPVAAVVPNAKLTDGQFVAVRASGLPADHTIQVEQCAGTTAAPPPDNGACDGLTLDTQAGTDAQGNYSNSPGDANGDTGVRVYTRPSRLLNSPTTITCDARHPCVLYVGVDQNDFSKEHVFVDIAFAAGVLAPAAGAAPAAEGLPPAAAAAGAATTTTTRQVTVTLIDHASAPAPALPAGGASGSLAFTGPSPHADTLAAAALFVVLGGSLARRRALRGGTP